MNGTSGWYTMFTEMRVRNFKSWEDSGLIRLAPVTGLFGTNSSGKTSLLQALLLLKQTTESADRKQVLNLGDKRSPTSLGLIGDVIHGHDSKSRLEFEFSWRSMEPVEASDPANPGSNLFSESELSFRTLVAVRNGTQRVEEFAYKTGAARVEFSRRQRQKRKSPEYDLKATVNGDTGYLKRIQGRAWGLPPPVKCYGFPDEAFAYFQNSAFVNAFELALERQFGNSLFYLGPLRQNPARSYRWQGSTPSSVGAEGERAIEALLASGRRPRKEWIARELKSNGHAKKLFLVEDVVSQWLREMKLVRSFYLERIAEDADIYRARIKRSSDSAEVLLPDVGFGVSQVLPVLVLLACVPKTSVVILEQPELHLHPAVQAALADVILETARVGRAQVIVESHSEYLLRRLQRRVAERAVSKEDIALYFCDHDDRRSSIERLDLNMFGQIDNWPSGFFGDPIGEAVAMVEAGAKRAAIP